MLPAGVHPVHSLGGVRHVGRQPLTPRAYESACEDTRAGRREVSLSPALWPEGSGPCRTHGAASPPAGRCWEVKGPQRAAAPPP